MHEFQLCLTLCDPLDCSPPGSTVQGIFQARILEWIAISFSSRNYRRLYNKTTQESSKQFYNAFLNACCLVLNTNNHSCIGQGYFKSSLLNSLTLV